MNAISLIDSFIEAVACLEDADTNEAECASLNIKVSGTVTASAGMPGYAGVHNEDQ